MLISNLKGDKMGKYYFIIIFIFNFLFSNYLDIQYASFSYTIGGSYGSCVKFKKSQYNFNSYNACSCAWAANVSNYSDCYELYYNPQTKMIKYNLYEGGEYVYRSFASDYSCHIYAEEIESPILDCAEMNEIECSNDDSCEWVEDIEIGQCSQFDNSENSCTDYPGECYWDEDITYVSCDYPNSGICNSHEGCYWDCYYGYCDCNGQQQIVDTECIGQYEIDNGYCEDIPYELGDVNQDSIIDILDIISIVNIIFENEYNYLADINSDSIINVLDIIAIVNRILN